MLKLHSTPNITILNVHLRKKLFIKSKRIKRKSTYFSDLGNIDKIGFMFLI